MVIKIYKGKPEDIQYSGANGIYNLFFYALVLIHFRFINLVYLHLR